jgi:succinyl-CoA synthetase beta subunit
MARLYEYQGKDLLNRMGIPIPKGKLATSPREAREVAEEIGRPVVLKAQVLSGGRGKAGGIKFAATPEEVEKVAQELLNMEIRGIPVQKILVEERLPIQKEFYLGATTDPSPRRPILMLSQNGGIDIEEMARTSPAKIIKQQVNILRGLREYEARDFARKAEGLSADQIIALGSILKNLYDLYRRYNCKLVEINPLVLSEEGRFIAADSRIDIDDDAIFRHPELGLSATEETGERPPTKIEIAAGKIDEGDYRGTAHIVQLDPGGSYTRGIGKIPIAFDCVGTGTSLTTMDELVDLGYFPINFADTSGNPTASKLYRATKIILSQPGIEGYLFVSCVSSQQLDNTARGIIKALKELYPVTGGQPNIPMVFTFRGGWDEEAINLFKDHSISDSPWVKILGRDATEKDSALEFDTLYKKWKKETGGLES